jgi:hypothetical protein
MEAAWEVDIIGVKYEKFEEARGRDQALRARQSEPTLSDVTPQRFATTPT